MSAWVQRVLHIQDGEWGRFVLFGIAFFALSVGIEFGRIGRDSYFLKEAGVEAIPLMYIFIATLMVISAPLYDRLVRRMLPDRLMIVLQVGGGVTMGLLWVLVSVLDAPPRLLPYVLFPLVEAYLLFMLMHFWTMANAGFDAWEGRRVFPYVSGAGLLGSLLAGLASRVLSSTIGANHLIGIWALLLVGTIPLTRKLAASMATPRRSATLSVKDIEEATAEHPTPPPMSALFRQPLLRTLAFMALPMWIIIYIVEYSYFDATNRVFPDQDALAGFLGLVVSLGAATGLVLQFTVTPWLLRRFGVGTASMVYPTTLTLGTVALVLFNLFPGSTAPSLPLFGIALFVVFARWCDTAFFFSVHDAAQQLLLYAVPHALRDKARVLMHAIVAPASIAAAGGLLILFRRMGEPAHNIAFVAVSLAFLLMVLGLSVTPEYLRSLLSHIHPGATEHRDQVLREIAKLASNDARYVLLQSITSRDLEEARFAVERLFQIKDDELINDMLESALQMEPAVLHEIERRMSAEERDLYGGQLHAALARVGPTAPA